MVSRQGTAVAIVLTLLLAGEAGAGAHYVSRTGDNTTGTSWAAAWNECNQIKWTAIQPGDTVFFDGGADSLVYTTAITVGQAGTAAGRITLTRSEAAGHNGKVVLKGSFYTEYGYITVDGIGKYKFVFHILGGGYLVRVTGTADRFEFKNVCLITRFEDSNPWGTPFYANNDHLLIKGCWFYDTNNEDQIKYNGTGTFIIEDSYFSGLAQHGAIHEDVVQFDVAPVESCIIRRSLFTNAGTDCFMLGGGVTHLVSEYNVFSRVGDAIKYGTGVDLRVTNTVFDRCRDILVTSVPSITITNSIFQGPSWSGPVHVGGSPEYSLWSPGTTYWVEGTGNLEAAPLFVDADNLLGPDGIPFTSDDGFRLQAGSPAIDAGTPAGFLSDIMGTAISGNPDKGAYEYTALHVHAPEPELAAYATPWRLPNPVTAGRMEHYLQAGGGGFTVRSLTGAATAGRGRPGPGLYLVTNGTTPDVFKVMVVE